VTGDDDDDDDDDHYHHHHSDLDCCTVHVASTSSLLFQLIHRTTL
jgi:hypothetical protein